MSAKLLSGKPVVECICQQVCSQTQDLNKKLCLIGFDEPRWNQYANSLKNSAAKYGFDCENVVVEDPNKDVDCLNPLSVCRLYNGENGLRPATPQAVIRLLDYYQIDLKGKNVVVVGRGNAVGKPLALMLLERNATVTVCHTKTVDLPAICRRADILVSACGVAGLITCDYVTRDSIVIDVGLSFVDGKTCGDVSKEVYEKCLAVSPVPGGIGPVTRATLFENLLKAAKGI